MTTSLVDFFSIGRAIFGVCPCCGDVFRLSDCRVFPVREPAPDWMDDLDGKDLKLDRAEERLAEREGELRERAREKGRREAMKRVRKLDPVFAPLHEVVGVQE